MTREEFFKRYVFDRSRDRLGAGSFGTVFKAYDTLLDCWVALKIAPATGESMRLRREVELVRNLPPHQNVANYEACYTFADTSGETDVAVLRYYPDGSLADYLERGLLPQAETYDVLTQILEGLRFLHSHGVVHRDMKPGNILVAHRPDGRLIVKITDFGISKLAGGDDDTVTNAVTVSYASPEQLRGCPVGANSDLWSFGVIAYRMLTGRLPFTSGDLDPNSMSGRAEIIRKITSGYLPEDLGALPSPWNRVIAECFVNDPTRRISDEDLLIRMIGSAPTADGFAPSCGFDSYGVVEDTVIVATDGPSVTPPSSGKVASSRMHPVFLYAILILAITGAAALLYIIFKRDVPKVPKVPMDQPGVVVDELPVVESNEPAVTDSIDWSYIPDLETADDNEPEMPVERVEPKPEEPAEADSISPSFFD